MLMLVLCLVQAAAAAIAPINGVVRDEKGGAIAGATVLVRTVTGPEQRTVTSDEGRFSVTPSAQGDVVVIIRARGFSEWSMRIAGAAIAQPLEVVLAPANVLESVTVTPARGEEKIGNVPASVTVLDRSEIRESPASLADDVLRRVPTFSLFRRTSSFAAHPTTQGVSLRGIGPSGVSRTLVLLDGIPYNDPFGGWVYWTRLPLEQTERIEIVDGASSSQYGNYALGGVINIVSTPATPKTVEVRLQHGSLNSPRVDVSGSDVRGKYGFSGDAGYFSTDGYSPVVATNPAGVAERGAVDNNVAAENYRFNGRVDVRPGEGTHAFVRAGYFREERNNGKHSTINFAPEENDTRWKTAAGSLTMSLPGQSELQGTLWIETGTFRSTFLAVPTANPPRSLGRMTLNQRVPTDAVGGTVEWRRAFGARNAFSAGIDWRWVDGDSEEDGLDGTTGTQVVLHRVSGGTQQMLSAFAQNIFAVTDAFSVTASVRFDSWRNYNAHNLENAVPSGAPTANNNPNLPERSDSVASPRLGAMYRVNTRLSVWGNIATGFRAPTLNELYRQFRVGTTLTLPNNQLGPERLVGGEAGVNVRVTKELVWRGTWFDNGIKEPVSNVTIATSGVNVTQQRQNLGRTRVRGVQTTADYRVGTFWRISGGYIFNSALVTEYNQSAALVGKTLPQVPRHRGTLQVAFTHPKYVNASLELLAMGRQFDDDLNTRTIPGLTTPGLPKYSVWSFSVSRAFSRRFDAYFGVQNLFNREYFVQMQPTTAGSPRIVNGGIRIRFSRP